MLGRQVSAGPDVRSLFVKKLFSKKDRKGETSFGNTGSLILIKRMCSLVGQRGCTQACQEQFRGMPRHILRVNPADLSRFSGTDLVIFVKKSRMKRSPASVFGLQLHFNPDRFYLYLF